MYEIDPMLAADLVRRLSNILRPGVISEVDYDRARVRVLFSSDKEFSFISAWLPFFARRAGNTIDWNPPEPGEQCLVLAPGGELAGGFVLTGIYSNAHPAPLKSPKICLQKYADGLECSYDQASHSLTISRTEELKVIMKASSIEFNTEKAAIKNKAGDEVLNLLSVGFKTVAQSKTATMMGAQPLMPAATDLSKIALKLDSFGGINAAEGN